MSEKHYDHDGHDHSHDGAEEAPAVLNASVRGERKTILAVSGMDCADEVKLLNETLGPLDGVRSVEANLMAAKITVTHNEGVTPETLIAAIKPTGMEAQIAERGQKFGSGSEAQRQRAISVGISGVLTGLGLVLQWTNAGPEALRIVIFAAATIAGGWFIFPKALAAARRFSFDMNLLMTVAVAGAAIIGEWSEGAAVTFLFGLSELLEAFSVQRARRAIESLLELSPESALVQRGGAFVEVPVDQVKAEEIVAVKSGSRVPLDGTVTTGNSAVNQAPITGESMPVDKKPGDQVFAGTINGEGALEVKVTKAAGDTMLARIIQLVGQAQSEKAPAERFVDVFAKYYTPAVMVLALLVFLIPPLLMGGAWGVWAYRALVLLVIACPCALVISTPVSIVSGLTAMARRGVLIKGGAHLESVGKLRALAVDKTGTIPEGKPRVQRVVTFNGKSETEVTSLAAAIDTHSEHPMARAVVAYAEEKKITYPRSTDYQSRTGRGAEARLDGHEYFVGNHRFAHELGICNAEVERALADIEKEGQSVVVVGHKPHDGEKGEVLGILAVGDAGRTSCKSSASSPSCSSR